MDSGIKQTLDTILALPGESKLTKPQIILWEAQGRDMMKMDARMSSLEKKVDSIDRKVDIGFSNITSRLDNMCAEHAKMQTEVAQDKEDATKFRFLKWLFSKENIRTTIIVLSVLIGIKLDDIIQLFK